MIKSIKVGVIFAPYYQKIEVTLFMSKILKKTTSESRSLSIF